MIDLLLGCVKSLSRRAKRTLLTVLSIAIGVASVVLISSLGSTGIGMIQQEIGQLGLSGVVVCADSKLTTYRLESQVCSALARLDAVEHAAGVSFETGTVRMHGLISNAVVWGVGENYSQVLNIPLLHGRFMDETDLEQARTVCLIDAESARDFYRRTNVVGKTLTLECGGNRQEFEIIGVVEAGGNGLQNLLGEYIPVFLYIPGEMMQHMTGKIGYSQISLSINEKKVLNSEEILQTVEKTAGISDVFTIENLSKQNKRLVDLLSHISLTLSLIGAISLVVAAIGTMTVMISAVKERTKEIGIKKSLGATNLRIMAEFLTESMIISGLGATAGIFSAALLVKLTGKLFPAIPASVNGVGMAAAICILLGAVFGMIPAIQAAKLDPVESLRSES